MLGGWRRSMRIATLGVALGVGACASADDGAQTSAEAVSEADAVAVLDLHALDIWAQPLTERSLSVTHEGRPVRLLADPTAPATRRLLLGRAATYAVRLEAPDHVALTLAIVWDGHTLSTRDASLGPDGGRAGVSLASGRTTLGTRSLPAHDLVLGLRHAWFSAQARPPRQGNAVELLMDGEDAWRSVEARLRAATRSVLVSAWWWDSSFELVRDTPFAPKSERKKHTILSVLDATSAEKRILVGQLLGSRSLLDWMTSDSELRTRTSDPRLQFMREGNDTRGRFRFDVAPIRFGERVRARADLAAGRELASDEPIASTVPGHDVDLTTLFGGAVDLASVHQKFFVVDDETAFVSGMNMRETDWDSSEHRVYDARRFHLDTPDAVREAADRKQCPPDHDGFPALTCAPPKPGPRKDYMLRIDGPAAADVSAVFADRWNALVDGRAADSDGRVRMATPPRHSAERGSAKVQITTTAPFRDHGIAESWFNAVGQAERFIYIEDQYFRMPMMHEAIARQMDAKPDLRLVVLTTPVGSIDPGCAPTRSAYDFFAARWPERFLYLTPKSYDPAAGLHQGLVDVFVHAKMLVVDDVFMSVGSANKNNRGLVYEVELNAAVVDRAFVTASRRRMIRAMVPDAPETDDVATWFSLLRDVANDNARRFDENQAADGRVQMPRGFLFPLVPRATCSFAVVGPDAT